MSVIRSEELEELRQWVRGTSDRMLAELAALVRHDVYLGGAGERAGWFRLRRLVAEEQRRRDERDSG